MPKQNRPALKLPAEMVEILKNHLRKKVDHSCNADVYYFYHVKEGNCYFLKKHAKLAKHESLKEKLVIDWLQGKLPVPQVISLAEDDEYYYTLLSAMPGIPAHKLIGSTKPYELIRLLVPVMKQIHGVPIQDCPFDETISVKLNRIRQCKEQGFLRSDMYHKNAERRADKDLQYLLKNRPSEENLVFTHGDFCLPNFLVEDGKLTAILDLGEAGICDCYMDICTIAITLCYNYKCFERFFEFCRVIFTEYGIAHPDWHKLHYYHLINEMI